MKVRHYLETIGPRLYHYMELQFFITLCSWPLLAWWGLPLSVASSIGNLFFVPFLSAFLLLSSVIFLGELIHIPLYPCYLLIQWLSSCWSLVLTTADRSWLFTTAHPPFFITLLLPFLASLIMLYKHTTYRLHSLLALYLFSHLIPVYYSYHDRILHLPYYKKELTILCSQRKTILIDPGVLGSSIGAPNKIGTTLIPFLVRNGIRGLSAVIIARPSYMVFKAVKELIELFPVTTVYMPAWKGNLTNKGWAAWQKLLEVKHNTQIICLDQPTIVTYGSHRIALTPSNKTFKKNRFIYQQLSCITHKK